MCICIYLCICDAQFDLRYVLLHFQLPAPLSQTVDSSKRRRRKWTSIVGDLTAASPLQTHLTNPSGRDRPARQVMQYVCLYMYIFFSETLRWNRLLEWCCLRLIGTPGKIVVQRVSELEVIGIASSWVSGLPHLRQASETARTVLGLLASTLLPAEDSGGDVHPFFATTLFRPQPGWLSEESKVQKGPQSFKSLRNGPLF